VVNTLIWLILGLTGFWLINVGGLRSLMALTAGFFSGALVPVWFMPDALQVIIRLLPFQAVTFLPASIFVGEVSGGAALRPILVQVAWIGILVVACAFTWSRAQRKLVIQGG
jgi:ABC-2 type transport system permease protein